MQLATEQDLRSKEIQVSCARIGAGDGDSALQVLLPHARPPGSGCGPPHHATGVRPLPGHGQRVNHGHLKDGTGNIVLFTG